MFAFLRHAASALLVLWIFAALVVSVMLLVSRATGLKALLHTLWLFPAVMFTGALAMVRGIVSFREEEHNQSRK
jgi:hypothetical protein